MELELKDDSKNGNESKAYNAQTVLKRAIGPTKNIEKL